MPSIEERSPWAGRAGGYCRVDRIFMDGILIWHESRLVRARHKQPRQGKAG
jgi:hypothetical protein